MEFPICTRAAATISPKSQIFPWGVLFREASSTSTKAAFLFLSMNYTKLLTMEKLRSWRSYITRKERGESLELDREDFCEFTP